MQWGETHRRAPVSTIAKKPGNRNNKPKILRESVARNEGDDICAVGVNLTSRPQHKCQSSL
ncbi:hypothetical protein Osc7112_5147 [Oscillatoria nigro-viridis PCC 7112]|uniref:Uncharacterized protein n=1 Tax=Phormidium nigroviride PCC 7112 TaxID=179408 RepID=K9VQA2_9CYAN|nr:hypothetical protein Osc7112_5147 [Oscillatoria nigro-viridis PCC 7112]